MIRRLPYTVAGLALLAGLGAAAPVRAATGDLATAPAIGPRKPIALPAIRTLTLDNGLKVTFVPFGTVPKVNATLVLRSGVLDEDGQQGLAGLAVALMNEGHAGLDAAEVSRRAADMGASLGLSAGRETISASIDGLSAHGPALVAMLAGAVRSPNLLESDLPRLKADTKRGIAVALSQPQAVASLAFARKLYPDHPFGAGYPANEQIDAMTTGDIRAFIARTFVANRAHLYIAGQFDQAAMKKAVRAAFGTWARGAAASVNPPRIADRASVTLVNLANAPQSVVNLGVPAATVGSADETPQKVMNALLGGSFLSRLTRNLREDKGWTYTPDTDIDAAYKAASWEFDASITTAHTGPAISEVLAEIARLQAQPPEAAELTRVKNLMTGMFLLRMSSRHGLIGGLSGLDFHDQPRRRLSRYTREIEQVGPADISRVARDWLKPERMTIVVVGDMAVVKPQLEALPAFADKLGPPVDMQR